MFGLYRSPISSSKLIRPHPTRPRPPLGRRIDRPLTRRRGRAGSGIWLRSLVGAVLILTGGVAFGQPPSATADTDSGDEAARGGRTETARQLRLAGRFGDAFETLIEDQVGGESGRALEAVLLARAAGETLKPEQLGKLYQIAKQALEASTAEPDALSRRMLLLLAVANHFQQSGRFDEAGSLAERAFRDGLAAGRDAVDAGTWKQLVALGMRLGWSQLNAGQAASSERLYAVVVDCMVDGRNIEGAAETDLALAMLGRGWAAAMQPQRQEQAAEWLSEFVERFPEHGDAAAAKALQVQCLLKAGRVDGAAEAVVHYLKRWPEQSQAETVVAKVLDDQTLAGRGEVAAAIEQWTSVSGTPQKWSLETVAAALVRCGHQLPAARFDFLLQRLGEGDTSGRHTAEILAGLMAADRPSVAEQVATFFIAEQHDRSQPMAMESACRWAGRSERWAMLALAAETVSPPASSPLRTAHVDRLFAESLTRTGRKALALSWWCHVVDHHQASDFGTLIRCAEAAVADGTIADARQRLDAVQVAIELVEDEQAGVGMRHVLLDLLKGDLAVRQIQFDQARSHYEAVVRSPAATAALLGRAQWMIGETYFLQRKFHAAIEAYRKVEGLDPQGPHAAAALIQAGKCFEQLGRTRQAGVCYGTLLSRFADSPHAGEARRRMAALSNGGAAGNGDSPNAPPSRLRR